MKRFFIIFLLFSAADVHAQIHADNSIELKYVSPQVKTNGIITPKNFDSAFALSMYTDTVVNKSEIFAKLWNSYKDVTYNNTPKTVDVRYKITLYFSVYTPSVSVYMNTYFETVDDKGLIAKGTFLKTLHHLVDAIIYKKKI